MGQGKIGRSYDTNKKKAVTAVQLTKEGKLRRMYAMGIEDFSARSLEFIFTDYISKSAKIAQYDPFGSPLRLCIFVPWIDGSYFSFFNLLGQCNHLSSQKEGDFLPLF